MKLSRLELDVHAYNINVHQRPTVWQKTIFVIFRNMQNTSVNYGKHCFTMIVTKNCEFVCTTFSARGGVDRRSDNATSVDVEIDPHCRRLGRSQTDFALQAIVERRIYIRRIVSFIFFSASSDMMTLYHDSSKFVPARKFQKT